MLDDLGEVDLHALDLNADLLALVLDVLHQLGGVQQALGGDAAHVQAGAAQVLFLDNGDLGAQLRGTDSRHIAAGAAADHQHAGVTGGLGGSRRGDGSSRSGSSGRSRSAAHGLAGLADPGQGALDGHIVALLGHDLQKGTFHLAVDLVGQLVGGDLHDHVTDLHLVALVLDPLGHGAFLHGQTQLGHLQFISHW